MEKSQVIEKTHKRYKLARVIGVVCMLYAVCTVFYASGNPEESPEGSGFTFLIGLVLYIYSKFGAWWRNG